MYLSLLYTKSRVWAIYFVRLISEPKLWVRLSQGVLAHGGGSPRSAIFMVLETWVPGTHTRINIYRIYSKQTQ